MERNACMSENRIEIGWRAKSKEGKLDGGR
jgi:hypothetical protein